MTTLARTKDILRSLVAFDTTSRDSNLALIDWADAFLRPLGAELVRLPNLEGNKANLWARLGPDAPDGVVLSGHTDVVPVDGQPWVTDPFDMIEINGKLYGRGTTDMKGFIALALAYSQAIQTAKFAKPVHIAMSYDEEIGCAGVSPMIEKMRDMGADPALVWVGEPTSWGVFTGHKGIRDYEVKITGKAAHSSDPRLGASAIHEAIELMNVIRRIAREAEANAPKDSDFDPSWPTLTIGEIGGGTAPNILARECRFVFDIRPTPDVDADKMLEPFFAEVEKVRARLQPLGPECGVAIHMHADAPPLRREGNGAAERFLRDLTGDNALRVAAYGTEAGQFQKRGFSSAICGPGNITEAHQPNEFLAVSELERGVTVFNRFMEKMRG